MSSRFARAELMKYDFQPYKSYAVNVMFKRCIYNPANLNPGLVCWAHAMMVIRSNYNAVGLILLLAIVNILQIAAVTIVVIIIIIFEYYTIPQKHAN
jgi:hypothetical protein